MQRSWGRRSSAWPREHGPVSLVGWSLGGVVAREVAREHPDAVRRLITYGTPVIGGPTFTVGADAYGADECARITQLTETLDRTRPITVPVTTIYTRRDGIVTWQACLDHASRDVEHVEVGSTHLGLGVDPDVWSVVATRLAHPVRATEWCARERRGASSVDYLVVGSGAVGMAFADSLVAESTDRVLIVDRHHAPGGHWNDAYPFVRLHQPSAYYGVNSRELDEGGIGRRPAQPRDDRAGHGGPDPRLLRARPGRPAGHRSGHPPADVGPRADR